MGLGSGIRDPGSGKNYSGSRIQGQKSTGSWIRTRNTESIEDSEKKCEDSHLNSFSVLIRMLASPPAGISCPLPEAEKKKYVYL
jgi:hypothetical protein